MHSFFFRLIKTSIFLIPLILSTNTFAQLIVISEDDRAILLTQSRTFRDAALNISAIIDPANHQCCVAEPPDTTDWFIEDGILTLQGSFDRWSNFNAPLEDDLSFMAETTGTIADIANVNSTFSGQIYEDVITVVATLGVDGKLFGETIEYQLEIDTGSAFTDQFCDAQCEATDPVAPKVIGGGGKSAGNNLTLDTNTQFAIQARLNGGSKNIDSLPASSDVIITTTISPDPSFVGEAADIFVVAWVPPINFTMINTDGNWVNFDPSFGLGNLVPYQEDVTLEAEHEVTLFTNVGGAPGQLRFFYAFSVESEEDLQLTPNAFRLTITE
jgi:hypothetical protein